MRLGLMIVAMVMALPCLAMIDLDAGMGVGSAVVTGICLFVLGDCVEKARTR